MNKFTLWRMDDNGNRSEIAAYQDRASAERALRDFEARGHKQTYWIEEWKNCEPSSDSAANV